MLIVLVIFRITARSAQSAVLVSDAISTKHLTTFSSISHAISMIRLASLVSSSSPWALPSAIPLLAGYAYRLMQSATVLSFPCTHMILRCRQIPKLSCRNIAETAAVAISRAAAIIFGRFCEICANSVRI